MISAYDKWATKEGPDFTPIEMTFSDWMHDEDGDLYAPFDETHCSDCNEMIGAFLEEDENGYDRGTFTLFWIMDQDCEKLFCEDCYLNATEEVE